MIQHFIKKLKRGKNKQDSVTSRCAIAYDFTNSYPAEYLAFNKLFDTKYIVYLYPLTIAYMAKCPQCEDIISRDHTTIKCSYFQEIVQ